MPISPTIYKIVLLGNTGVGKTSICSRLTEHHVNTNQEATIGASFLTYVCQGTKLQIWDTAGQERYRALAPMYFRGSHGCILVFDVTNRSSFTELQTWYGSICANNCKPAIIVVGNKIDKARIISYKESKAFADSIDARYAETSAATGESVHQTFDTIIRHLQERWRHDHATQSSRVILKSNTGRVTVNRCYC